MRGEIEIIIHATENMEKILSSISRVLKININRNKLVRRDLSGHYGNPIIYLSMKLDDDNVKNLFLAFRKYMDPTDLSWLLSTIDDYIERSTLYLRIDKQKLCKGELKLVEEDPIKIIIKDINENIIKKMLRTSQ